jgi:AcrR family transcriptional regulator
MPVSARDPRPLEVILGMTVDPQDPARLEFERLLRTATEDFDRHGWNASFPRMAARLKRSKSVFYHYAVDKEALLYLCYDRGLPSSKSANGSRP